MHKQAFRARYAVAMTLILMALGWAVTEALRVAWSSGVVEGDVDLVAPDDIVPVGVPRAVYGLVIRNGRPLSGDTRITYIRTPEGQWRFVQTTTSGLVAYNVSPLPQEPVVLRHELQLSPEDGHGRVQQTSRIFFVDPGSAWALVDLEPIGQSGRYQIGVTHLDWLRGQLGGRGVIYLADVDLAGYGRLRDQLADAGWPEGPLVPWRWMPTGNRIEPQTQLKRILDRVRVELAILPDLSHNASVSRQISRWNEARQREGRPSRVVSVVHWPADLPEP